MRNLTSIIMAGLIFVLSAFIAHSVWSAVEAVQKIEEIQKKRQDTIDLMLGKI